MSRVDLQDPEALLAVRRELLAAVSSSERIAAQTRLGVSQLIEEAARRVAAMQRTVRDLELRASATSAGEAAPDAEAARANAELSSALRTEADVGRRAHELLAALARAAIDIRTKGSEGAGFLSQYHANLTGARSAYATIAASGAASQTSGPASSPDGTDRERAIETARQAVQAALASERKSAAGLTTEETEALRRYTSDKKLRGWEGRWYEIGNALLRGARQGSASTALTLADLERFESVGADTAGIAAALRGLDKLPPVSGDFHRGISTEGWASGERDAFLKEFSPGNIYRDVAFFSGSRKEDVARAHAGPSGLLLHVSARNARSVEHLSIFGPIEHELVLRPWTQFRVRRIRNESSGLTRIWLEEIGN